MKWNLGELPDEVLLTLFELIFPWDVPSCKCVCTNWWRLCSPTPFETHAVSAGFGHSLAFYRGDLFCWGDNEFSQCCESPQKIIETTHRLDLLKTGIKRSKQNQGLLSISAGHEHSLALTTKLQVLVWGADSYRKELGLGVRIIDEGDLAPKSVIQIAAGSGYSLVLTDQGECFSWGSNAFGELGLGHLNAVSIPTKVKLEARAAAIAVTKSHWCPSTLAATDEGNVYGWGSNYHEKLFKNDTKYYRVPQLIPMGNLFVIQVACGSAHSLILTKDGLCYSWGDNWFYQQGRYRTINGINENVLISNNSKIIKIATGSDHNLALSSTGVCYSWGRNEFGQLGHSTQFGEVSIPMKILDISAGSHHSIFLCPGNQIYTCGSNQKCQLAMPIETTSSTVPVSLQIVLKRERQATTSKARCCCQ